MCREKDYPIHKGDITLEAQLTAFLEDIRQSKNQMWLTTSYVLAINGFFIGISSAHTRLGLFLGLLLGVLGVLVTLGGIILLTLYVHDLLRYRREKCNLYVDAKVRDDGYRDNYHLKSTEIFMFASMLMAMLASAFLLFCFI